MRLFKEMHVYSMCKTHTILKAVLLGLEEHAFSYRYTNSKCETYYSHNSRCACVFINMYSLSET